MATTSIWAVKGWLGKLVVYVENPDKTDNPAYFEKQNISEVQAQGLSDVIDYAVQSKKTQEVTHDENEEFQRRFVSGVNCRPTIAREQMAAVKQKFGKTDGVVAYHGFQSFAPDEATPEMAHEIGIKMAERLWGERYQVIVATHLDKKNHLHNHFIVNNVSIIDGRKYYRSERDYWLMQQQSDRLCREYGLSVIENPKRGRSKQYGEWRAEQEGRPTWRSIVKTDIDAAVAGAMTERQFWDNLKKLGYEFKIGKDISVRPPGKERFFRLTRNFGEDYAIEGIRKRILAQTRPKRLLIQPEQKTVAQYRFVGILKTARRMTGLRALYYSYLYKMGVLPKKREQSPKQVYFLFREDIRKIRNISEEVRLLCKYRIDTGEQLSSFKDGKTAEIISLCADRKRLRYKTQSIRDEDKLAAVKSEISVLSERIGKLCREVRLCEDIETRSADMKEKIRRATEETKAEKIKGKEKTSHESFRGRR